MQNNSDFLQANLMIGFNCLGGNFMTVLRSFLIFLILTVFTLTAGTVFALTKASFDVKDPKNQEINKKWYPFTGLISNYNSLES